MVFSHITREGRGDNDCRHGDPSARDARFCVEPGAVLGPAIQERTTEDTDFALGGAPASGDPPDGIAAQALPNEATQEEERFREKIKIARFGRDTGNLDEARQQLLVMTFDPTLPTSVMQELAIELSRVDLYRFSLSLCERLFECDSENADIAYELALYSSMCGKPQYVTDMYLIKACELEPNNLRYRLAFVCWLLGSHRVQEAIVHSGSPNLCVSDSGVCGDCLSWAVKKFAEYGNVRLADAWATCVASSPHEELSACCANFQGPSELRRAW